MAVSLSNNLLKLVDLSPFIRNTNVAGDDTEVKAGPHAIVWDGAQWRCYFEGIENTDAGGTNDQTSTMLATASSLQGPWALDPATRLLTAAASPSWENEEMSPSSAIWEPENNRWVIWFHGGNNSTYRRIGVLYSTDGQYGRAFTRDGGNPILDKGTAGDTDDKMVSDLKMLRKADGSYIGFYCGRQNGGPSCGTIHKVTGTDAATLTKQGEVIAEGGGGTWNVLGMYPSHVWIDENGRFHMFACAGDSTLGGIGYFYSDDEGDTWTQYGSNPVAAGSGTTTAFDEHIGDVGQLTHDGDVLFVTTGCYASAFTNAPLRGQGMYLTPARAEAPTRTAKFYLPTAGGSQTQTSVTGTSVLAAATGAIIGRFRAFRLERSTQYRELYTESAAFNIEVYFRIQGGAGANAGKLNGWLRTPTAWTTDLTSLAVVDDGQWHVFMVRRQSASSADLWLDGALQDTDATNISTTATATNKAVGNWHSSAGVGDEPFLGSISDLVTLTGAVPTWDEAMALLADRASVPAGGTLQVDFPASGTDQGNVVTVEGTPANYPRVRLLPAAAGLRF